MGSIGFRVENSGMTPSQGNSQIRLEPLHKKGQHLSEEDLEKQLSRLSETNNHCCRCCGLTRFLKLQKAWFIQDPCGIICAVLTYVLLVYGVIVTNAVLLFPLELDLYSSINGVIFNTLGFLALVSHIKAMMNDPGAIPLGNATRNQLSQLGLKVGQVVYRCPKCVCIKPERTHHCSVCKRCIRKMDHHCPWVNNCVGEYNQKYFVLFTLYIALVSLHSLLMLLIHFISCVGTDWGDECAYFSVPATIILMMTLGMEGLLFSLFTLIMFCTQLHAICTDETGIEQLKREQPTWTKKGKCLSMKAVFGSKMSIDWLNPFVKPDIGSGKDLPYMYSV